MSVVGIDSPVVMDIISYEKKIKKRVKTIEENCLRQVFLYLLTKDVAVRTGPTPCSFLQSEELV